MVIVKPVAFVRPSPTAGTLGGVVRATRESLVVMAAAGYDILLVETVGVGQSETLVAQMTDTFLLLSLARTGDQLQGIKKGVLELADIVAVNRADGPRAQEARRAARELAGALRLLGQPEDGWATPVGETVDIGAGDPFDQAVAAEPGQVIGGLVHALRDAAQSGHPGTKALIGDAGDGEVPDRQATGQGLHPEFPNRMAGTLRPASSEVGRAIRSMTGFDGARLPLLFGACHPEV